MAGSAAQLTEEACRTQLLLGIVVLQCKTHQEYHRRLRGPFKGSHAPQERTELSRSPWSLDRPTRRRAKPRLRGQGLRGRPAPPSPIPFQSNYRRLLFPFPVQAPCTFSPSLFSPSSTLTLLYLFPPLLHLSFASSTPLHPPLLLLVSSPPPPSCPFPSSSGCTWVSAHTIWGTMWFLESRSGIPKSKFGLAAPLLCPRCCAFGNVAPVATRILGDRGRGRGEQAASEAGKLSPQPNVVCL